MGVFNFLKYLYLCQGNNSVKKQIAHLFGFIFFGYQAVQEENVYWIFSVKFSITADKQI